MKRKILLGTMSLSLILAGCGYMSDDEIKKQDHIVIVHNFPNDLCESVKMELAVNDIAKEKTGKDVTVTAHTERANNISCHTYGKVNDSDQCLEAYYDGSVEGYPKGDKACVMPYTIKK